MKLTCPRITYHQLWQDCETLGVKPGDLVMVHSSLKAVGDILGGPDVLIDALLAAVGSNGTLMMYAGCQTPFDDVGRGMFTPEEEAFIEQSCPPFDYRTARANRDHSALAELFRTRPGCVCSTNVGGRMAAIGDRAKWLTDDHPWDYGLGKDSPLDKLYSNGGKVLLVGSDPDAVTLLHFAEAISPIENKRLFHLRVPMAVDGKTKWVPVVEYDSSEGICAWPDKFFDIIVERFIVAGHARTGKIGNATSYLLDAKALVDFAIPIMVETAHFRI